MDLQKAQAELERIEAEAAAKAQAERTKAERVEKLQAAVDAENKRLNSKEYKAALKAIDDLAEEAKAKKQTVLDTAERLKDALNDWKKTVMERRHLANEHRIETKDLYNAEAGKIGRLLELEKHILQWFNNVRLAKALSEPSQTAVVHKRSILGLGERERMMEERYPKRTIDGAREKMLRERYPEE